MTAWLPLPVLLLCGTAYASAAVQMRRRGDQWPAGRSAALLAGLGCLGLATLPPLAGNDEQFSVHVWQHLLLSSLGPLLLALSAPATLALRTLPLRPRRALLSVVHSRLARIVVSPVSVLVLDVGALYALYLTPLFAATESSASLHGAVHLHMVAAGCLLSWYLVGVDPLPRRGGVRTRLVVLLVAAGAHGVLAKLLYAHAQPAASGSPDEIRAGAQLLYYGGDLVEVLLAVVLLSSWYAASGRRLSRAATTRASSVARAA